MSEDSIELRDVCSLIKRGITPKYGENGLVVVNQRCIRNGVIELMNARIHDIVQRKVNAEKILVKDDILVNSTGVGTAGRVGMWIDSVAATCDTHVTIIRPLADRINPTFLFYFLRNMEDVLHDSAEGSTGQTELKRETIGAINTPCFRMSEQEIIAQVLCSLDDKIDLLKRQNKTLEGMAEALFRQWFIEEAQDDWEETSFEHLIEKTIGGDWGKEQPIDDFESECICIRGTDIADYAKGIPANAPTRYLKKSKVSKTQVRHGDVVMETSGGTDNQSTGRTLLFSSKASPLFSSTLVFSNFCRLIRPKHPEFGTFLHYFIKYLLDKKYLFNLENGTSGIKNLDYKTLLFFEKFPLPGDDRVFEFHEKTSPQLDKVIANKIEVRNLEKQRDTLLPKLMSGEVRVQMD